MRERPILFSAPMVRAILDGRKAQTRRIVQIPSIIAADINDADTASERNGLTTIAWLDQHEGGPGFYGWLSEYPEEGSISLRCPYGVPGDRLWVRETSRAHELTDAEARDDTFGIMERESMETPPFGLDGVLYAADNHFRPIENTLSASDLWAAMHCYRGKRGATVPGTHMPRWASRIILEVVGVRVERLQDLRGRCLDFEAEGITIAPSDPFPHANRASKLESAFRKLWDSLNAKRGYGWDANPWVWRIEFKRIANDEREG